MSKQQQHQRQSRNSYFYNSVQAHVYTAQPDANPQQRFYESHLKQSRNRGLNQSHNSSSQSNNVPKTLSCVFQRNSSNKKSLESIQQTTDQEQQQRMKQNKNKSMPPHQKNINNIKIIQESTQRELQATDYQLFSSDEEMEKVFSPQKEEEDLEATLASFHNVRSNHHQNKINRLLPQTIESFVDTLNKNCQQSNGFPISCFNSGGKSSLKKNLHNRGSSQNAKKVVSYLSDLYSLVPIHQKFTDLCSTSKHLFNQTHETLGYEPVQKQQQPQGDDFLLFKDIKKQAIAHKELKGRALSAASIIQPIGKQQNIARKLVFGSQETSDYLQIQQMRHQITQLQLVVKQKDAHINTIEYQYEQLAQEYKRQEVSLKSDIQSKEELINRMQGQIEQLLTANDQLQKSWNQERAQMIQVQDQVSKVCQDQLQSFYELNKKSETVIERLESELSQALSHIEYLTTRNQAPSQYQEDLGLSDNLGLTQQELQPYMDTYEQAFHPMQAGQFEQQHQFTPAVKRPNKKLSIDRDKLIKQNTGILMKKGLPHNKENSFLSLQSRNNTLAVRPKSVNYTKSRANNNSLQMNSMYSKALLALLK